jgi:hypothetical protein
MGPPIPPTSPTSASTRPRHRQRSVPATGATTGGAEGCGCHQCPPAEAIPEQINLICGLHVDSPRTHAAAHSGGYLRGRAKAQVALRDGLPRQPCPRLAEFTVPD